MVILTAVFAYTLLCAIVPTCDFVHEAPDNKIRDEYYTGRETETGEKILKNPYPVLFTNDGGLQGYSMGTVQGNRIYAFEGIPYGQAPIGHLRFRSPIPSKPWNGIRAAHKPSPPCLQVHPLMIFRVIGNEDCLFMNIYTPQLPEERGNHSTKIPVIVWFHGGSFIFGQSNEYGPSYIVDRNVILVTVNYRLGVLGFMSTGDEACPGNMGLKDQTLALKWIHENIQSFGGSPGRVTIMGQKLYLPKCAYEVLPYSIIRHWRNFPYEMLHIFVNACDAFFPKKIGAGAVSVHLHMVSNKSREYFQAGISMSASGFTQWGVQTKKQSLYWTNWLADVVKCPTTRKSSSTDLVDCFRSRNPAFLVSKTVHLFKWLVFPPVLFAPVVEPMGPDAFLSDTVENHYRRGDVARYPWIGSLTSQEGYVALYVIKLFQQLTYARRMFPKLQQYLFSYDEYFTNEQRLLVDEKIRKYYFHGESPETVPVEQIVKIFSDRYFIPGQIKALKSHSQLAPTYAYLFGHNGHTNIGEIFGFKSDEWGVGHNEDSFYFFNSTRYYAGFHKGQPAMEMSQIMVNLIGNFADIRQPLYTTKTGERVAIWDQVQPLHEPRFLSLNRDLKMISNPYAKDVVFWESLGLPDTTPAEVFNYTLKASYFRSNRIL